MHAEVQRRLGHARQAMRSIRDFTAHAPLQQCLGDALPSLLGSFARLCDWEHPVVLQDLVGNVGGDLKVWRERLMAGLERQDEGAKLDPQITENHSKLGI